MREYDKIMETLFEGVGRHLSQMSPVQQGHSVYVEVGNLANRPIISFPRLIPSDRSSFD